MTSGRIDPIRALGWIEGAAIVLAAILDALLVIANPAAAAVNRSWYAATAVCAAACAAALFAIPHAANRRHAAIAVAATAICAIGWLPPDGLMLFVFSAILCARLTFSFGLRGAVAAWIVAFAALVTRLLSAMSGPLHAGGDNAPHEYLAWILLVCPEAVLLALIFGMIALMKIFAARSADAAASEERGRIALDLHDFLGHGLTTLRVQLQNAERYRASEPEKADDYVRRATQSSEELLVDVRETVALLRERQRIAPSFSPLFERLCAEFAANHTTAIDVRTELEREPSGRVAIALYRTIAEALTNVSRHARAKRVIVTVRSNGRSIEARIEDDGSGIDDTVRERGHGLLSMRQHVTGVGGTLAVESPPSGGTVVTAVLPEEAAR